MYIDVNGLCSDQQSVVGAAGNYLSERSINRLAGNTAVQQDGMGNDVPGDMRGAPLYAAMDVGLDSAGGACTIEAQLVSADDEGLTTNLVVHARTAAIPEATAIAGYEFELPETIPPGIDPDLYVGFRFVTAGEAATVGKVTAAIGVGKRQRGWLQR